MRDSRDRFIWNAQDMGVHCQVAWRLWEISHTLAEYEPFVDRWFQIAADVFLNREVVSPAREREVC